MSLDHGSVSALMGHRIAALPVVQLRYFVISLSILDLRRQESPNNGQAIIMAPGAPSLLPLSMIRVLDDDDVRLIGLAILTLLIG